MPTLSLLDSSPISCLCSPQVTTDVDLGNFQVYETAEKGDENTNNLNAPVADLRFWDR
jgi:hypothetical protein